LPPKQAQTASGIRLPGEQRGNGRRGNGPGHQGAVLYFKKHRKILFKLNRLLVSEMLGISNLHRSRTADLS